MITPNRGELRQVVGRWADEARDGGQGAERCARSSTLDALLVTRSEEGMSLYTADGADDIPAVAREVFDVTGAGDTVIATLGVLLGAGARPARRRAHRRTRRRASSSASSAPRS